MNDKLIMENYLLVLKSTVEVYVHGTLESSHEDVRSHLKDNLNTTLSCQANTFDLMKENGWYQVTDVDNKEIRKTLSKVRND